MKKTMYLIRGGQEESYAFFWDRILSLIRPLTEGADIKAMKFTCTREAPPRFSVIPFRKGKVASISVYQENDAWVPGLHKVAGFAGAYQVEEAFPVAYEKTWEDGQLTPGICLLTLFRRKKGLDYDEFLHRWHSGHTPLSLRTHPLWNYSRNVVLDRHSESAELHEGIVEEHLRQKADLLNPVKFFGPFWAVPINMLLVYLDTISFLDYGTIEPYWVEEMHVKTMSE